MSSSTKRKAPPARTAVAKPAEPAAEDPDTAEETTEESVTLLGAVADLAVHLSSLHPTAATDELVARVQRAREVDEEESGD